MFRSLPFSEPNPLAEEIEGAPYGATKTYPNLFSPEDIANELILARQWGIRAVEVTEDAGAETARRLVDEFAGKDCLYVVLPDGRMFIIPSEVVGGTTTHTMAANGADVIAAGHVLFGPTGKVRRWDHMSGHYRPDERQAREVAEAIFTLAGLRGT